MKFENGKIVIGELEFDHHFTLSDIEKLEGELKLKLRAEYDHVKFFSILYPSQKEFLIDLVFKYEKLDGIHVLYQEAGIENAPFGNDSYRRQAEELVWLADTINRNHDSYFSASFQDDRKSGFPHLWVSFK